MRARPPRFVGGFRIAHVGVIRHVGGGRIHRLARAVGQILGGDFHLLHAHAVGILGFLRLAFLALTLLIVAFARILALVLGIPRALVAHLERVEKVVYHVAKSALLLDQLFQAVEFASRAVFDE